MITQYQAEYLLSLPKELSSPNETLDLSMEKIRIDLFSPDDSEWDFLFEITNNKKKEFKISFHHQENNSHEGLLRVDYNGGHRNPETATDLVPEFIRPYAGRWFHNESHIHLFVEGYKDLAWAIPLTIHDNIQIKNISSPADHATALHQFAAEINIITKFVIQYALL